MSIRRPPPDQRLLHTDDDLTALWQLLMEAEPYRRRSLWLLFIDTEHRPAGPIITVDDLPDGPYETPVDDLVAMCRSILDGPGGGGSVAILMTRPGSGSWTVSDRAWGRFLLRAAETVGGRVWPVHQARRGRLEEFRLPETG
ncbi:MAG: hypothetical protein JWQ74_1839 [Marmoricola sp.]|nr:hypothetical protein [Marmoricola sp.]